MISSKNKWLFISLLGLVIFQFGGRAITRYWSPRPIDYYQFWVIGQEVKIPDHGNLYSKKVRKEIAKKYLSLAEASHSKSYINAAKYRKRTNVNPGGTPFLYAVFSWISTGNFDLDLEIFRILSLLLFLVGYVLLCLRVKMSYVYMIPLLLFFTEYNPAFHLELRAANVNLLQFGLLALVIYVRDKFKSINGNLIVGGLLGFLLFFKPNVIYIVILLFGSWAIRGEYKSLLQIGASFLIVSTFAVISSSIVFGDFGCWAQWRHSSDSILISKGFLNQTFIKKLSFIVSIHGYWFAGFFLTGVVLLGVYLRIKSKALVSGNDYDNDFLMVAMGWLILLNTFYLIHRHYFVVSLVGVIYFLRPMSIYEEKLSQFVWFRYLVASVAFVLMLGTEKTTITNYYGSALLLILGLTHLYSYRRLS